MKKTITIMLSLLMLMSLLIGCSKEVTVDAAGLQHMVLDGAATALTKEGYTATLIPDANYDLPESITVTMEDQGEATFTYDPVSGQLTFPEVTGNITLSGTATESIVGTWAGTADFTEMFAKEFAADPATAEYFTVSSFKLDLTMEFDAEGICTLTVDEESAKAAMDTLAKELVDGMVKMLDDMLKQQGVNMSTEDYLTLSGITLEDLTAQLTSEMQVEDMLKELENKSNYHLQDGKLWISDDLDSQADADDACPYTLAEGVLTIEAPAEAAEEDAAAYLFPLVLNRVG